MKRSANATWKGGLKDGAGSFGVQSGAIKELKFGLRTRFEDAPGTTLEIPCIRDRVAVLSHPIL